MNSSNQNQIPDQTHELSCVGKVLDAHGIRGDVYCIIFSGDNSWINQIEKIKLDSVFYSVKKIKAFKKGFIATLAEIDNRNKAEALKGKQVWVDSSLFVSKDGEALYLSEILNFIIEDKNLGVVGTINAFSSNGLQDLLVISNNSKTFEIPFVKDFVIKIDHIKKIIYMILPEGLLEINEQDSENDKN